MKQLYLGPHQCSRNGIQTCEVVFDGDPVSCSRIPLRFSLGLFFFSFRGSGVGVVFLLGVNALAEAASGIRSVVLFVRLGTAVTVTTWRIAGASRNLFILLFL